MRDVLKSELSTSVPVATPVVAVGAPGNQTVLMHPKEGETHLHTSTEAVQSQEGPKTGNWTEQNTPLRLLPHHVPAVSVITVILSSLISTVFPEVHYEA